MCHKVFGTEAFLQMKPDEIFVQDKKGGSSYINDSELTTERNFMKKFNQNFNPSEQPDSQEQKQASEVGASFNDSFLQKQSKILNQSENIGKLNVSGLRISNMYKTTRLMDSAFNQSSINKDIKKPPLQLEGPKK